MHASFGGGGGGTARDTVMTLNMHVTKHIKKLAMYSLLIVFINRTEEKNSKKLVSMR
jgi:hypothetical protein